MELFGVLVRPVDADGADIERYGEVIDVPALMASDDRGRDFCDGQTSALPPEHADDPYGMLYTYDRATADYWSGIVRRDLAERVVSGDISVVSSWMEAALISGRTAAAVETILAAETLPATIAELRQIGGISALVTDSQIQTQIAAYIKATGNSMPTLAELLAWIKTNARWS